MTLKGQYLYVQIQACASTECSFHWPNNATSNRFTFDWQHMLGFNWGPLRGVSINNPTKTCRGRTCRDYDDLRLACYLISVISPRRIEKLPKTRQLWYYYAVHLYWMNLLNMKLNVLSSFLLPDADVKIPHLNLHANSNHLQLTAQVT